MAALFEAVYQRFSRFDLLFNNTDVGWLVATSDELSAAAWREVMDTNFNGALFHLNEAFKLMRHQDLQGIRIINNSVISAYSAGPSSTAHTAKKHVIFGLTRAASLEG